MLSDFNLESPKVVVFITSHSSWEWVLVAEVAQFLKSEGRHVVVHYLDISFPWNRTNSDPKEMLARELFDTEKIELRPTVHHWGQPTPVIGNCPSPGVRPLPGKITIKGRGCSHAHKKDTPNLSNTCLTPFRNN